MKKIKSTVTYRVPHWNFCNGDSLFSGGHLSEPGCRFCISTKAGYYCSLHDKTLDVNDGFIKKTAACCKITADPRIAIDEAPQEPTIPPKEIMKRTIDLYAKTVNDLIAQGYPKPMADNLAKQYILGQ